MAEKPTYEELEQRIEFLEKAESERKSAEAALRRNEARVRAILENLRDVIYATDKSGTVTYVSPTVEELTGYRPEEVIGRPFIDFVYPEDVKDRMPRFLKALAGEAIATEYRFVTKNDEIVWVRTQARPNIEEGEVKGLHGVLVDITERKRAEEALIRSYAKIQEEQNFNQLLLDTSPAFIVAIGLDGKTLMMNKALLEAVEYTLEEVRNTDYLRTFVPEEAREGLAGVFRELLGERGATQNQNLIMSKSGRTHLVEWHGRTVGTEGAVPDFLVGVGIDITERKRMEEERERLAAQLLQSQKRESIGALAGGIAHDFNNILSGIIGFTEIVKTGLPEGSRNVEYLAQVLKACDRARDLVKQILAFSRQTKLEVKPLRLELIVKEALKMLRSSLPASIEIRQNIGPDLPVVIADPTQIHQIIMNLCTNAAHAIEDENGTIEVSMDQISLDKHSATHAGELSPGNYVRLKTSDTGGGIPPEIQERIFDPYFTTKKVGEGTGLGLAVAYGIVKDCGGGISIDSKVGEGTTFTILLPAVEYMEDPEPPRARQAVLPFGREHILFVDDEPPIIEVGRQNLERLGYQVTVRTSSLEALELFRNNPHRFDLVITDMTMPHMTGDKLAAEMLSIRADMPIILCTGYSRRISEKRAGEMGIRAFVMKPWAQHELANKVREVLDEKPLKQQLLQ